MFLLMGDNVMYGDFETVETCLVQGVSEVTPFFPSPFSFDIPGTIDAVILSIP